MRFTIIKTLSLQVLFTICASSHALEVLDNEALASTTGQDGLTITLKDFSPNARLIWIDNDGAQPLSTEFDPLDYNLTRSSTSGAVIIGDGTRAGNFDVSPSTIILKIDADGGASNPFLNMDVNLVDDMTIKTGNIYVANRENNGVYTAQTKILRDMVIDISGFNLNIQLGNTPQGSMIVAYGTIKDGLQVSNMGIIGRVESGNENGVGIQKITVKDSGNTNDLSFNGARVSILNTGLVATPSVNKTVDILMEDIKIGNLIGTTQANSVGDIALQNLKLGGTSLTIVGH